MKVHIEGDKVITEKNVKTIENKLNKQTNELINMTKAGQKKLVT